MNESITRPAAFGWVEKRLQEAALPTIAGNYNRNHIISHEGRTYLVRVPIHGAPTLDIRLTPEWDVLPLLAAQGFAAPRLWYRDPQGRFAVHEFLPGQSLDQLYPVRAVLPDWVAPVMAVQLAQLHQLDSVPFVAVCGMLAAAGDSCGVLLAAADYTERFWRAQLVRYRQLYESLAVPPDPLASVRAEAAWLTPRAFVVCHCDTHRRNLIVAPDAEQLTLIDWELTTLADPAYELAQHLHKIRYQPHQEACFLAEYGKLFGNLPPAAEIAIYRRHEQIRSALIDTARMADDIRRPGVTSAAQLALAVHLAPKLARAWEIWQVDGDPDVLEPAQLAALLYHATTSYEGYRPDLPGVR
ncbi:MAG TPA: phosphotransferase [Roseiflexaceae bacterium]|nr:phosphotransferase [Roseiflexaceae bacterium]